MAGRVWRCRHWVPNGSFCEDCCEEHKRRRAASQPEAMADGVGEEFARIRSIRKQGPLWQRALLKRGAML